MCRFTILLIVVSFDLFFSCAHCSGGLTLTAEKNVVRIANGVQRVSFRRNDQGAFRIETSVRQYKSWKVFFDARRPLIEGPIFAFDLTDYSIIEDSKEQVEVQFRGPGKTPGTTWKLSVQARADSPLIFFRIASHLKSDMAILGPQPTVALWMKKGTPRLKIDQGPVSQLGDRYRVPFNYGFPAAYLWDGGREAAIFFDMTPMTWMSGKGVFRFNDIQIKSLSRNGQTGLGLHPRSLYGSRIHAGEVVIPFYLYSGWKTTEPSKFEAIHRMIQVFAPLHPATSQFPTNTFEGGPVSWELFAQKFVFDAMHKNVTYGELHSTYVDRPLDLVKLGDRMIVHPTRYFTKKKQVKSHWSGMTINHHLVPWNLYTRLIPGPQAREFAKLKIEALPRFYDHRTKIISGGTEQPRHFFSKEHSWQSMIYYQDRMQIYEALAAEDFNPAIAGKMLMGMTGLMDLAHNVKYVFPTFYDPKTKQPVDWQNDTKLGDVREPLTVGAYSYVLVKAYEVTGESLYVKEAIRSLNHLMRKMTYTEDNKYYKTTYKEAADMPICSLIGNAYGAVGAYKLYQLKGDRYLRSYSQRFLNGLVRLTYWYEDNTDAISRELRNAGLFIPFGGGTAATTLETTQANLCMIWMLKHDRENSLYSLMLKLTNLNRINSFYFYPATFGPASHRIAPRLRRDIGMYFPMEPLYGLECQYSTDDPNASALYMAGTSLWNWWMYEALAVADISSLMVLNLDSLDDYEKALTSAQRNLIVFNPTDETVDYSLKMKNLAKGDYTLTISDRGGRQKASQKYSETQLTNGIPMSPLTSMDHLRLTLRHSNAKSMFARIEKEHRARNSLSHAYEKLQERAGERKHRLPAGLEKKFKLAMQAYREKNHTSALSMAESIIKQLRAGDRASRR